MYDFSSDPAWREVRRRAQPRSAIVLLASRSVLEKRMSARQHIEPEWLAHPPAEYPVEHWMMILKKVDLRALYMAWCAELEDASIPYTLLGSENMDYEIIESERFRKLDLN